MSKIVILKRDKNTGLTNNLGHFDIKTKKWSDEALRDDIHSIFGKSINPEDLPNKLIGSRMWAVLDDKSSKGNVKSKSKSLKDLLSIFNDKRVL